ncbi:N-acetylneuraminate synthase family protein [Azospirillum thermophilum]|nr:N-acetylneuraminate synthase family protein [Azospirillum thermophilum]
MVIAEIGINHNGNLGVAKKLIDLAHRAGCDAVKFQKRTIDIVYTPEFLDQPRESPWGNTQRAQKEALEFGVTEYDAIDAYCRELGIAWFASAWDVPSQEFLRRYDCPYNKIASAMLTHDALVEAVARERKPTFISTGMADYADIDRAVAVFRRHDCPFTLMHCVATYPAAEEDLNLRCIPALAERYGCPVGYSGHEPSVSPSVVAAMMGAVAIERHITISRAMYGSDQAASLEGRGIETLVAQLRKVPVVLGDGVKRVLDGEKAVARKLRYWETEPATAS